MPSRRRLLTSEEQAKLASRREEINRAYEQGGSYSDEEVAEYIEQIHSDTERQKR
jgi:hypothetical protein